jgi:4'-phosphopantetheinyl transferase EntD
LSVRHLLATFGYSDTDLFYDSAGKPHLKDGKHISISHSFIFSAVAISDQPIGVDVEKQREKIGIIAHKFVKYENDYLNKEAINYINKLTVIWCVKESLYKLFATPGMLFKEHFLIIPFMLEDHTTTAWIDYNNFKHRFSTDFIEFEGFTCAYALPL